MKLPPLDSVKMCPKCGCRYGKGEVNVSPGMEWHTGSFAGGDAQTCCFAATGADSVTPGTKGPQHLSRICLRCEYRWPEACWVDPEPRLSDE